MLEGAMVVFEPTPMVGPGATVVGVAEGIGLFNLPTPKVDRELAKYRGEKLSRAEFSMSFKSRFVAILDRYYLLGKHFLHMNQILKVQSVTCFQDALHFL